RCGGRTADAQGPGETQQNISAGDTNSCGRQLPPRSRADPVRCNRKSTYGTIVEEGLFTRPWPTDSPDSAAIARRGYVAGACTLSRLFSCTLSLHVPLLPGFQWRAVCAFLVPTRRHPHVFHSSYRA